MTDTYASLKPQKVWAYFRDLNNIPRPSGHEQKVALYLKDFARSHNYDCSIDKFGNVIINVKASEGKEKTPKVILQAHMDMVPVAKDGITFDFLNEPIKTYIDGTWVKAYGTTLGADDGIGIATILALLDNKELKHGPLTAIFTVEEETTMKGALGLDAKDLDGDYLINLDSEENDQLYIGCAGSCDIKLNQKINFNKTDKKGLEISLTKLLGGHSGADINLGHANAICVMARILSRVAQNTDFEICSFDGGTVRNSIPSFCKVKITAKDELVFKELLKTASAIELGIYKNIEKEAILLVNETSVSYVMPKDDSKKLLNVLQSLHHGVVRMSDIDSSIVETSINLGTVRTSSDGVTVTLMPRSLKEDALLDTILNVKALASLSNLEFITEHQHSCWLSPQDNTVIRALNKANQELYGRKFNITLMHAGLETATFAKTCPKLQLVSLGATILYPHSPQECVDIDGVNRVYNILLKTLSEL